MPRKTAPQQKKPRVIPFSLTSNRHRTKLKSTIKALRNVQRYIDALIEEKYTQCLRDPKTKPGTIETECLWSPDDDGEDWIAYNSNVIGTLETLVAIGQHLRWDGFDWTT